MVGLEQGQALGDVRGVGQGVKGGGGGHCDAVDCGRVDAIGGAHAVLRSEDGQPHNHAGHAVGTQSRDQAYGQPYGKVGVDVDGQDQLLQRLEAGRCLGHQAKAVDSAAQDDEGEHFRHAAAQGRDDVELVVDGIPVQEDRHCGGDPHAEHQRIHGGQVLHATAA